MFKAIILLKRKSSMSLEEFSNWWLLDHAPIARQLPGLKKAVFNLADAAGESESEFDGVSELWFDSAADFNQAYDSEIGKKVAADSMSNVSKRERLLVSEHTVLPV